MTEGKRRFIEDSEGEEYVHKAVWLVAKRQFLQAEAHPKGALLDHLVVLVFVSHALEGYANYLLNKVAPALWQDERTRFVKTGLAGKLDALHELCGLAPLERGKRPWSTLRDLQRLRDRIAHPRIIPTSKTTSYVEGKEPPLFARSWLEETVSEIKATRAMHDAKRIVDALHEAAMARFPDSGLLPEGLEGILSTRRTSARLLE